MKKVLSMLFLVSVVLFVGCSGEEKEPIENITIGVSMDNTIYNGVETVISISTNGNIKEATFYFDGQSIGSKIAEPFTIKYTPKDANPGGHTVKCVVISSLGNRFEGETKTNLELRLGDEYQGGKIFYIDNSGEHGLIGSKTDLTYNGEFGEEIRFSWGNETLLGTNNKDGQANTVLMANKATSPGYAGFHFKNGGYTQNGYSDWYIPSINELEILKENKSYVGGFSNATDWQVQYWSSSESNATKAFILNFNALMGNTNDKIKVFKIRPIRKF